MRVTADPVKTTTWTDATVSSGTHSYQVKAAKLDSTTGSGRTYVNTSQALTGSIALVGGGNHGRPQMPAPTRASR